MYERNPLYVKVSKQAKHRQERCACTQEFVCVCACLGNRTNARKQWTNAGGPVVNTDTHIMVNTRLGVIYYLSKKQNQSERNISHTMQSDDDERERTLCGNRGNCLCLKTCLRAYRSDTRRSFASVSQRGDPAIAGRDSGACAELSRRRTVRDDRCNLSMQHNKQSKSGMTMMTIE